METVIRNAKIVNEGRVYEADVLIKNQRIDRIGNIPDSDSARNEIDASGLFLLPGCIDDQVHFREPGLTHKGEIYTEAKAAVAGGITSFMEMPNTVPSAVTIDLLEEKYIRASKCSLANYSFYLGATNTNLNELIKIDKSKNAGVKIFMGSSTGDMLVDDTDALEGIFKNVDVLIATHCEVDSLIKLNAAKYKEIYGDNIPFQMHPIIRSAEACYLSSVIASDLAKKYNSRLHILHISTEIETNLFRNDIPLEQKRITSEACIHHLWFSDNDYATKGPWIKWNPAVKTINDRNAIRKALLDDRIDVIATDHAPHTIEEKENMYTSCPSGGPLVQHALPAMLEFVKEGWISIEKVVEKMAHAPAICFQIEKRGFIREGYFADLVLVDLNSSWEVNKSNILYKCGWSPFEEITFNSKVVKTFVNGHLAYDNGAFNETNLGMRLQYNR
jgi:dihydroorotase